MLTKADIEKYFIDEKQISLILIIISIAAIIIAVFCWFYWKTQLTKGAAIPLLIIALLQFVFSFSTYKSSDNKRVDVIYAFDMNPDKLQQEELPRMQQLLKQKSILQYTFTILFFAGALLVYYFFHKSEKQFWTGFAIAVTLYSLVLFSVNFFADKKSLHYTQQLKQKIN